MRSSTTLPAASVCTDAVAAAIVSNVERIPRVTSTSTPNGVSALGKNAAIQAGLPRAPIAGRDRSAIGDRSPESDLTKIAHAFAPPDDYCRCSYEAVIGLPVRQV
jgi:hypothetical protein